MIYVDTAMKWMILFYFIEWTYTLPKLVLYEELRSFH